MVQCDGWISFTAGNAVGHCLWVSALCNISRDPSTYVDLLLLQFPILCAALVNKERKTNNC